MNLLIVPQFKKKNIPLSNSTIFANASNKYTVNLGCSLDYINDWIIIFVKLDLHKISTPSLPVITLHNAHPHYSLASSNNNFANPSKLKSYNYSLPLIILTKHPSSMTAYLRI